MIHAVRCDQPSFRTVRFAAGFNIVLADRTDTSTERDSRNGLGKSSLLEVIHFCLGAGIKKGQGLGAKELAGWEFTLDFELGGAPISVSRSTANAKVVMIEGDIKHWPMRPTLDRRSGAMLMAVKDWNALLGLLIFGLPPSPREDAYQPTFRSLVSYFARRGPDAYSIPFEHHRKQLEWDKQVNTAFLLDLAWEDASERQRLRDKRSTLDSLRAAGKAGLLGQVLGTLGELEAERVRLARQIEQGALGLAGFNVHPQYRDVEKEALGLTRELHELSNIRFVDTRLLEQAQASMSDEQPADDAAVAALYEEAGVTLPAAVVRRLQDVQQFHRTIVTNRRTFLQQEVERLQRRIRESDTEAQRLTDLRAAPMRILKSYGPWEEYSQLQQRQAEAVGRLQVLQQRIANLRIFEEGRSALRIESELLTTKARQDYAERSSQRQRAVTMFNENSEELYKAPGNLVIDVESTGYRFNVEIQRAGSDGVSHMKVFCYDLMLAELWSTKPHAPGFLVHDSIMFDSPDSRQNATALQLAAEKSQRLGFQYICTMNSDRVPWADLEGFELEAYVRLRLTDLTPEGSLFGIRF